MIKAIVITLVVPCLVWARLKDWLINDIKTRTTVEKTLDGNLVLTNELISRVFSIHPDFTTIDFYSHEKQASILRALSPEAIIALDGVTYEIGHVNTSIPRAYLNRTALKEDFNRFEKGFHFDGYSVDMPQAPYPYTPMRGAPKDIAWPPKGLRLNVCFKLDFSLHVQHTYVRPCIHYEMYDGIPAMSKWITLAIDPLSLDGVKVQVLSLERLAVNQQWSQVSHWDGPYNTYKWLYVGTNQPHGSAVIWTQDPVAGEMPGSFEEMVDVTYSPPQGEPIPSLNLKDEPLESFHVHLLAHGGDDETRRALARHRLFRLLAPQAQENPIFFHMTQADNQSMYEVIDQLAEVGFEMVIYSFGSGFNLESSNETYLAELKEIVDYAHSKGIEVSFSVLHILYKCICTFLKSSDSSLNSEIAINDLIA